MKLSFLYQFPLAFTMSNTGIGQITCFRKFKFFIILEYRLQFMIIVINVQSDNISNSSLALLQTVLGVHH